MHAEVLFKKAFIRTKERFLDFVVASLLGWGLSILLVLALGIVSGIVFLIWLTTHAQVLTLILALATFILLLIGIIYVSSWVQLATVKVLTQKIKTNPFEVYKKVKPLVPGYIFFLLLLSLFFLGLLPFTLLSLFIVGILWSLWNSFSVFVYLEGKKRGLENLWTSRSIVNQRFWQVLGFAFVLLLATALISGLFLSFKSPVLNSIVTQFFIAPFLISFYYELYSSLKPPAKIKTPSVWVGLSVVGFLLLIVLFVVSANVLQKAFPQIIKQMQKEKMYQKDLPYSSPYEIN